jgi:hypothetical protein
MPWTRPTWTGGIVGTVEQIEFTTPLDGMRLRVNVKEDPQ